MTTDESLDTEIKATPADEDESGVSNGDVQDGPTTPDGHDHEHTGDAAHPGPRFALVIILAIFVAVAGVVGWLGYRAHQSNQADQRRTVFLTTARQEAINLTTLSYTEIDADIKRIVDSTTGDFYDQFQRRSPAFADVVRQAQSKSVGTVTAAGVESISVDQARVLVAVSVKTSNAGQPEQQPRSWRMRISVAKVGDGVKVSDVAFVP